MMMSYDQSGGHHSEYTWGNKMIDQGASILPEQQVAAGLPFYGKDSLAFEIMSPVAYVFFF
eukprot:COSAG02_NODE_50982_length_317_cov_0.706422_2_plen_60_part_01